jgi:hypothetical protein
MVLKFTESTTRIALDEESKRLGHANPKRIVQGANFWDPG